MNSAWNRVVSVFLPVFFSLACGSGSDGSGLGACKDRVANGQAPLVDDMTDGDKYILFQDGRQGGWYTYNDGTGTQTPKALPPNVCDPGWPNPVSHGQACTSGSGFTKWGASLGVSVNMDTDTCISCSYDATVYGGVRFTISGDVPTSSVRFSVVTAETQNVRWGGTCTDDTTCTDTYGASVTVTSQSQIVQIPWAMLKQQGWGTPTTLNLKRFFALGWQVPAGGGEFNFCISDLSFF